MARDSLHNRRGFFSDYWLGSMLARRETGAPKFTAAKLDKLLWRIEQLTERVSGSEPLDLTRFREKFARPLLDEVWGFAITEPDDTTADEPRFRFLAAGGEKDGTLGLPGLLLCPDPEALDAASTRQKLDSLLQQHSLDYGFILTPEVLRLVRRSGNGPKGAAFDVSLASIVAGGDRDSLESARRLLHCGNFHPDAAGRMIMAEMEAESLRHRARVSAALKQAVFEAAEVIIRGFLSDLRQRADELPPPPSLNVLRDNALLVLYRLLFILYAESRDERLQTHGLYRRVYSLESMVERLIRQPEGFARNRFELWSLLQATFRIFDEGMEKSSAMPGLENIPPRGGPLFAADAPGAEWASRLRLGDAEVAALLFCLATAKPRRGVGRERISYRELAIEQLGSVYEGLLEYEPKIAEVTMFDLRIAGREFVLPPAELIRLCREKDLHVTGPASLLDDPLLSGLHAETGGEETDGEGGDDGAEDEVEDDDTGADEEADSGLKNKAGARLLRRLDAGEFYFAPGGARKSSGSYYTRDEIVQYLTRHALGEVVADATPDRILDLRVIDLACGSAHFLVGAARWLAAALLAAYHRASADPPPGFHPGRSLGEAVRHEWEVEGEAWCKRRVVENCLYGVDLNPTAVQLAQVALWIESLAGDRPLSFFAHHIRCGNSLIGTSLENLGEPPLPDLAGRGVVTHGAGLFAQTIRADIQRALEARALIDSPLPPEIRADSPEEYDYKNDRLTSASDAVARARLLFDLRSVSAFVPAIWGDFVGLLGEEDVASAARQRPWWAEFERVRERERFFHWQLEFPEIFFGPRRGFDAVLGNPPWEQVKPKRIEFYALHDVLIRAFTGGALDARIRELEAAQPGLDKEFKNYEDRITTTAASLLKGGDFSWHDAEVNGRRTGGDPDLFKFFIERAFRLLCVRGKLGYLIPAGIYSSEGCTGLRRLLLSEARIITFFGFENRKRIFDIDATLKFVCLTAEKLVDAEAASFAVPAVFMRHDVEELETGPPEETQIAFSHSELAFFSPGTFAFPEFRTERDRHIVLKMYGRTAAQAPRPLLGDRGDDTWDVRYGTEFHLTSKKALWTESSGALWTPSRVLGDRNFTSMTFADLRAAMLEAGFWPLYEGKQIEQWIVDTKSIQRWLRLETYRNLHDGNAPAAGEKLVFRDIAKNVNERTCIAAVLPEGSCSGNTLATLSGSRISLSVMATVMNSIAFDYVTRFKTVGRHLNWTYISRVPVPRPVALSDLRPIPTRSAADTSRFAGQTSKDRIALANNPEHFEELWQAEQSVARAYGLNADDFAHILGSFPVMARKREAYHRFLLDRTAAWRQE